eukprot:TRINITY_DN21806_c0_g1_i1.p1 TRINITY_DN21806_c0_g1~~TRINITY_DN21806_c0_g1_i1.p1  ORF type:complete len:150 (+),score=21.28 TRINITY_DN21806_c0_g1_i1:139-588(+)
MQRGLVGSEMCIRDRRKTRNIIISCKNHRTMIEYERSLGQERSPILGELKMPNSKTKNKTEINNSYNPVDPYASINPLKETNVYPRRLVIGGTRINKNPSAVSYTHLTLPTILLVQISVVAVSLKKKKQNIHTEQRAQNPNQIAHPYPT